MSATSGRGVGLAAKIFLASALLVLAVLGATFGIASYQATRTADAAIARALQNTRVAVQNFLAARTRDLAGMSAVSATVPQFRERLLKRADRNNVLDQAGEYRELIHAAWVLVADEQGILIARTDYPDETDRDLSRGALVANALSGETASGAFIDDRDPARLRLYQATATPLVSSAAAAPQGVLIAAYAVDDSLAVAIRQATNSDVVFFALDTANRPVIVGSTLPEERIGPAVAAHFNLDTLAADTAGMPLAAQLGAEHLIGIASPLRSAGGDIFGGFVAFRSREAELASFRTLQRTTVFAVAIGIVLAVILAFGLARGIARPVQQLAFATRKVQDGDYSVTIPPGGADEIGDLARAFHNLVEDLKEKAALVEYLGQAAAAGATQLIGGAPTAIREVAGRPSVESGGDVLRPGSVFAGRYEVKEILGAGGMGVVYRAWDRELGEAVAIKTLRPDTVAGDPVALERFKQEIRLARRISHRNVVRTYDLGEVGGTYYLTMEFVEGTSLKSLIHGRGKLPVAVTLTVGKQLCRALAVAHEMGVIHRDIKPQNMVVEPSGFLKVMDFGIARLANPPKGQGLTEAGMAIGTPDYMSPEQLSGTELDARSDLYSAGVVLFECLAGQVPFQADSHWTLIAKHLEEEPPDVRQFTPEVPEPLAALVRRAMSRQPEDRFQRADEMADALAAIE